MTTKQEFLDQVAASISSYPTAAQFYQARDPRLMASLEAMATMLAMASMERDVQSMEQFTKARDVTVLADASIKGVLPFGTPTKNQITITNTTATAFTVLTGRVLLDTQGRPHIVDQGATVPASGSATVTTWQQSSRTFNHTVSASQPFYLIPVAAPENERKIVKIQVKLGATEFAYVPDFVNVAPGDQMFHLFTDEFRDLYIEFGATTIAGYQPAAGEVFTITVTETEGQIEQAVGSQFTFETATTLAEAGAALTLAAVLQPGADPMDIRTMREVTSYPSIYDPSAVYLGNFDFLLRRQLSPFKFLSVWNEQREEEVRGPDIDNINRLFVSALKDGVAQPTLEAQIVEVIRGADDSYRITFVAAAVVEIPVEITIRLAAVYDTVAVQQQVIGLVLTEYGIDSPFAKRGQGKVQYKRLYDLIENNVPALQDREADMQIAITDAGATLPEQFRYVSPASLTVNVLYG